LDLKKLVAQHHEKYKEYAKKGKIVKLAVWPAVFLSDKGSLMNKGYAMPS
jgi:hypothetical protein